MTAVPDATDIRDFYEERAGLIEFDGGIPRREAESAALEQTAAQFGITIEDAKRLIADAGDYEP